MGKERDSPTQLTYLRTYLLKLGIAIDVTIYVQKDVNFVLVSELLVYHLRK